MQLSNLEVILDKMQNQNSKKFYKFAIVLETRKCLSLKLKYKINKLINHQLGDSSLNK
jgi:hypothetical protein